MKSFIMLALLFLPLAVNAYCTNEGGKTNNIIVNITVPDNDCSGELVIQYDHLENGKERNPPQWVAIPFKDQCKFIEGGLECRKDGITPLAGTTWKSAGFDETIKHPCVIPPVSYRCISGCENRDVPKQLYNWDYESDPEELLACEQKKNKKK